MANELIYKILLDNTNSIKSIKDLIDRQKELKKTIQETEDINSEASKKMQAEYTRNAKALTEFNRNLRGSIPLAEQMGNAFVNASKRIGAALLVMFGIREVFGFFADSVSIFKDFNQAMASLQAISGATAVEIELLEKQSRALGQTTKFTSTEIANLQIELSRAGFATDEILKTTDAVVQLSLATGEDLVNSAITTAAVIRGFNLDASESTKVVDTMAQAFNSSGLGLENFTEAIKIAGPAAKAANIDFITTTTLLGKLADVGIKGSIAGTGFKQTLAELADENSKVSKAFGLTVKNGDDLINGLIKMKQEGFNFQDALNTVGQLGASSLLALVDQADNLEVLRLALRNSGGAAEETAKIMQNTLSGSIDVLSSSFEGLQLDIGEGLEPIVRRVVVALTAFLETMRNLPQFLSENKLLIGGIGSALLALKFGKSAAELKTLIDNFRLNTLVMVDNIKTTYAKVTADKAGAVSTGVLSKAMNVLNNVVKANPILFVVTALFGLVAVIKEITDATSGYNEEAKLTSQLTGDIVEKTKDEAFAVDSLVDIIKSQNTTQEQKNAAYEILRQKYPDILDKYGKELTALTDISAIQKEINANIVQRVLEEKKAQLISEQFDKELDAARKIAEAEGGNLESFSFWEKFAERFTAGPFQRLGNKSLGRRLADDLRAESDEANRQLEVTLKLLPAVGKQVTDQLNNITESTKSVGADAEIRIAEINKNIELMTAQLKNASAQRVKDLNAAILAEKSKILVLQGLTQKEADAILRGFTATPGGGDASPGGAGTQGAEAEKEARKREAALKKAFQDEKELLQLRIEVLPKLSAEREERETELVKLEFKEKRRQYQEDSDQFKLLITLEEQAIIKLQQDFQKERQEQLDKFAKEREGARKAAEDQTAKAISALISEPGQKLANELAAIRQQMNAELLIVGDSESKKQKVRDKFRAQEIQATRKFLEQQQQVIEEILNNTGTLLTPFLTPEQTAELVKALSEIRAQITDLAVEEKELVPVRTALGLSPANTQTLINAIGTLQALVQGFGDIQAVNAENRSKDLEDETEKQKAELQRQLDNRIINQATFDKKTAEVEKAAAIRQNEIAKQQFEVNKRFQTANALINGAAAIIRILADVPKVDFGIATALLIAGAAATTTAQVIAIQKQKFAKGTVLRGASHEAGGIDIYGRDGHYYGEAEEDEIIMTKGVFRSPLGRRIASDLNEMFGGVRFDNQGIFTRNGVLQSQFPKFAAGTILSQASRNTIDSIGIISELERLRSSIGSIKVIQSLEEVREGLDTLGVLKTNAEF